MSDMTGRPKLEKIDGQTSRLFEGRAWLTVGLCNVMLMQETCLHTVSRTFTETRLAEVFPLFKPIKAFHI